MAKNLATPPFIEPPSEKIATSNPSEGRFRVDPSSAASPVVPALKTYGVEISLVFLYFLSRIPLLDRELTFEEPLFSVPGINLFLGKAYAFYGGEFDPQMSAFHKPPLLTFLVGLCTSLFGTGTVALRLIPFLLGLVSFCLFLAILREIRASIIPPALVYITMPFLVVGANQIQTDGSVGVLGYLLVTLGTLRLVGAERQVSALLLLGFGVLWLSLAKVEILTFSLATLFVGVCIAYRHAGWRKPLLAILAGIALGQLLLLGFSYVVLGTSAGYFEVYGVPISIIGSLFAAKQAQNVEISADQSWEFFNWIFRWHIPQFVLASILAALILTVSSWSNRLLLKQLSVLLISLLIPSLIYLLFTYSGDGFPRYLLIVMPATIAVLAMPFRWLSLRVIISLALVGTAIMQLPRLQEIYAQRISWTGYRGQGGFQQAGSYLQSRLTESDIILAPDPVGFYYGRKYYDPALIESYPTRYEALVSGDLAKQIRAWVYFDSGSAEYYKLGRLRKLYDRLQAECRLGESVKIGTLRVLFIREESACGNGA